MKPAKTPRPKKRTAGVEVVKIPCRIHNSAVRFPDAWDDDERLPIRKGYSLDTSTYLNATLTVHIPKRRSSK